MSILFNNLLKLTKIFKNATLDYDYDENELGGKFYNGTFVGDEKPEIKEYSGGLFDPEYEKELKNEYPKSKYQELLEDLGDQKTNGNSSYKMYKIAEKAATTCHDYWFQIGFAKTLLTPMFKEKYKSEKFDPLKRIENIFLKYSKTFNELEHKYFIGKEYTFQYKYYSGYDKEHLNSMYENNAEKIMEIVNNFFEDLKIFYEILSFEEATFDIPTQTKWPITERPMTIDPTIIIDPNNEEELEVGDKSTFNQMLERIKSNPKEIISAKNEVKKAFSELRAGAYRLLGKLQIYIDAYNKIRNT